MTERVEVVSRREPSGAAYARHFIALQYAVDAVTTLRDRPPLTLPMASIV
jgi:hypothetical protein